MDKDDYRALFSKAKEQYEAHAYPQAIDTLNSFDFLGLNYDDRSLVYHYLALCHSHLDAFSTSLMYFELAKKEEPQTALIDFNQGMTYYFLGTREKHRRLYFSMALRCFNHALDKDSSNPEYWYYRGFMHTLLGKTHDAVYCYERVFSLAPRFENRELCDLYETMYVERYLSAKQLSQNIQRE